MPSRLIINERKYRYLHLLAGESGQRRRGPNETRDNDSPASMCLRPCRRADKWVEVRETYYL